MPIALPILGAIVFGAIALQAYCDSKSKNQPFLWVFWNKFEAAIPAMCEDLRDKYEPASIVVAETEGCIYYGNSPDLSELFGPLLAEIDPNVHISKQLAGKGQLRDLRRCKNYDGVNVEDILSKTPAELGEMARGGELSKKTEKTNRKAFEGRDLGKRGKNKK
jgi:hypothetical protein